MEIIINATPKKYSLCFWRTIEPITLYGGCKNGKELQEQAGRGVAGGGDNIYLDDDIGKENIGKFDKIR